MSMIYIGGLGAFNRSWPLTPNEKVADQKKSCTLDLLCDPTKNGFLLRQTKRLKCSTWVACGRCNREKPPCKYFHPPQHLKDQLLINGRNHLALKNALMQQMTMAASQQIVPGQVPTAVATPTAYLTGIPGGSTQVGNTYTPYFSAAGPLIGPTTIITSDPNNPLAMAVQQTMVTQQKMPRNDRLDMDMKAVGTFYYENFAFPGMMQYKRAAGDKSGMPVFQQNTGAYQQLLQPFVPTVSFAAPPGIPRY
ncbi:hypothetical protein QTP88_020699 [Uroleucon formosanum]